MENDTFPQRVFLVMAAIPCGRIATYGDIARMAGSPQAARQVGRVLKQLPTASKLPWHRIINSKGEIAMTGERGTKQKNKLAREGILPDDKGRFPLKCYRWQG